MRSEQRKFTIQYNEAIIRLIRHKFQPLQHSKLTNHQRYHQSTIIKQTKSCHITPDVSLPSLPSSIKQTLSYKSENECLLERAKEFIKSHRRDRPNCQEKIELREYIELFQKPIGVRQKAKRDSIELSLMQFDTRQKLEPLATISKVNEQIRFNEQQISVMNAKIRRKLNHKKMIDLGKRT